MRNSKKIRQLLLLVIVVAGVALAAYLFLRLPSGEKDKPRPDRLPANVDLALKKVRYTEIGPGGVKWTLEAETAEMDKRSGKVFLTRPVLVTMRETATTGAGFTVEAERAEYDVASKQVELTGGVSARSGSGIRFITQRLLYQGSRSLVTTSDRVKFDFRGMSLEGQGLEARTDSEKITLHSDVQGRVGRPTK